MRYSESNANRWLAETAAANKRQHAAPGRHQRRRANRARCLVDNVKAPGSALGIVARAVGLLLAFGSFILATAPGGAA